jgi:hypothetical protein
MESEMTLQEMLTNEVLNWEIVGHHALLQRFVLRQGKAYINDGRKPLRGLMEPNECFRNATVYSRTYGGEYVEGYVFKPNLPILIHHAWAAEGGQVIDPTLRDNAEAQYFGVRFNRKLVLQTTMRQGFYGMLDTGLGLNTKLMFGIDPGLEAVVNNIKPHPAFANQIGV